MKKNQVIHLQLTTGWEIVGKVVKADEREVTLTDCARIYSTGRFHQFSKGELDSNSEVEPYTNDRTFLRDHIVEFGEWSGKVPLPVK